MSTPDDRLNFANYAVGFVDILGQRTEYAGEGLLPTNPDGSIPGDFVEKARRTIGAVLDLQQVCDNHLEDQRSVDQAYCSVLPAELRPEYERLRQTSLRYQRWSDGVVYFQSLAEGVDAVPMNGVSGLTAMLGPLCYLSLAKRMPIRGAIDIAWAAELRPGEIYGAAVARAYELESQEAKWPRIVVGKEMVRYLDSARAVRPADKFDALNCQLAEFVRSWIETDVDGNFFVHYLGAAFRQVRGDAIVNDALPLIRSFIDEQLTVWRRQGNTKLVERYDILREYYERNA